MIIGSSISPLVCSCRSLYEITSAEPQVDGSMVLRLSGGVLKIPPVSAAPDATYAKRIRDNRKRKPGKAQLLASLDTFTRAYLECALWSSTDEQGRSLDQFYLLRQIHVETLRKSILECKRFQEEQAELLEIGGFDDGDNGQDFWLTRNRHGAGFWERGYPGSHLTAAAHAFGECYPQVTRPGTSVACVWW